MARIAVAGNQWITEHLVRQLTTAGHAPALIINMGRHWEDRISGYSDLASLAQDIGAKLYRPEKYNLSADADRIALQAEGIDVLLVFGWQRLVPAWLIEACRHGVYGVHGGPEKPPRCRGRAVFNWSLILGYDRFYMYLFQITPEADAGDILAMTQFDITAHDDVLSLYNKNCIVSSRMFIEALPGILAGTHAGQPQTHEGATFLPKREPANSGITWTQSCERITNLIRASAPPYPTAFTELDGMRVDILQAHLFDAKIRYPEAPGTIVERFPNGHIVVTTGTAALYVRALHCDRPETLMVSRRFAPVSGVPLEDPQV